MTPGLCQGWAQHTSLKRLRKPRTDRIQFLTSLYIALLLWPSHVSSLNFVSLRFTVINCPTSFVTIKREDVCRSGFLFWKALLKCKILFLLLSHTLLCESGLFWLSPLLGTTWPQSYTIASLQSVSAQPSSQIILQFCSKHMYYGIFQPCKQIWRMIPQKSSSRCPDLTQQVPVQGHLSGPIASPSSATTPVLNLLLSFSCTYILLLIFLDPYKSFIVLYVFKVYIIYL